MGYYSFNRPRRDGRLSWPCWLTDSGRLTHKVVTRPAISQAQDRESSFRTGGLTTMLRHQHLVWIYLSPRQWLISDWTDGFMLAKMHSLYLSISHNVTKSYHSFITPPPVGGRGIVIERFLSFFRLFFYLFLCFFVSNITRKRLDRFAWNFQGRCGVTMGRPDSISGQFG